MIFFHSALRTRYATWYKYILTGRKKVLSGVEVHLIVLETTTIKQKHTLIHTHTGISYKKSPQLKEKTT